MTELRLYILQRLTALIMAPLVAGHILVMILAIDGGLTTAEILSRTQGSWFWRGFYGLFVVAVSVHGAIGLRNIGEEWLGLRGSLRDGLALAVCAGLLWLGLSAVAAVT